MSSFKDYFSKQADIYAKYRPKYPPELFSWLASLTKEHELAWDCGTGNGQAATDLAAFYKQVIATDPSEQQIKNAIPHPKVKYLVEKAESNSIPSASADLLTIANALHWFDFDAFFKEARRILKPGGIIAAWSYCLPAISPEIDRIIAHYHNHTLDDYWLWENRLVEKRYTTIPFPFEEINHPAFFYEKKATLDEVIGGLNTWSATQRFIEKNGYNPTEQVREELQKLWGEGEKNLKWELALRVGRI